MRKVARSSHCVVSTVWSARQTARGWRGICKDEDGTDMLEQTGSGVIVHAFSPHPSSSVLIFLLISPHQSSSVLINPYLAQKAKCCLE